MTVRDVGVALVHDAGRILVAQRRPDDTFPGRWEFPGGKLRDGESAEDATVRECREELGCAVRVLAPARVVDHEYPGLPVRLHFFWCAVTAGRPEAIGCAALAWAERGEIARYDFLPADRGIVADIAAGRLRPPGEMDGGA